jgi:hypothetical protein
MAKKHREIDCTQTCRMTRQIRESQLCSGKAKVVNGNIIFGCQERLSISPIELKNYYKCNYWNMEIFDACLSCPLSCPKNESTNLDHVSEQRAKIKKIMEDINPLIATFGMSPRQAEEISKKYKQIESDKTDKVYSDAAIEAAEFAKVVMEGVTSGKNIDINFFKAYTNNMIDRLNHEAGTKLEKIDYSKKKARGMSEILEKYKDQLSSNKKKNTK